MAVAELESVAQELGITLSSGGLNPWAARLHGMIDGQAVQVTFGDRGARAEARIDPPLDLGLTIRQKTLRPTDLFSETVRLGDSDWDDEVVATADEAERARLLLDSPLKRLVLDLNASASGLEIDDASVATWSPQPDAPALIDQIRRVALVAGQIDRRRSDLPPAGPLAEHARVLAGLAGPQLALSISPLHLTGTLGAARLAVRFRRSAASRYTLELHATPLEPGPECGLTVRPATLGDRAAVLFGGEDIEIGEPRFDRAFRVRCLQPARARAIFDEEMRATLFEISSLSEELTLTERSLLVRTDAARVPAVRLAALLHAAAAACERTARVTTISPEGPYR